MVEPVIEERVTMTGGLPADVKEPSLTMDEEIQTPLQAHADATTFARAYEGRLREIFDSVRRISQSESSDSDGDVTAQWDVLVSAVGRIVDPATLLSDQFVEAARAPGGPSPGDVPVLEGDAGTVDLLVAAAVERITDPTELERFIRGSLATTLARLEGEGIASREQCADIIVRVLRPLLGSPPAAALAARLLGYLAPQQERTLGFYFTAGTLASIAVAPDDPSLELRGAIEFVYALDGISELLQAAQAESPGAEGGDELRQTLEGPTGRLIAVAVSNIATVIGKRLISHPDAEPEAAEVLRTLLGIAAAVRPDDGPVDDERAGEIIAALRLPMSPPKAALTVLEIVGGAPAAAWGERRPALALLQAASGVAEAANGQFGQVAARFFNAGLYLTVTEDAQGPGAWRAQLLLNALGLRWSLVAAEGNVLDALVNYDGLDCAVNFMAAIVGVNDAAVVREWAGVEDLTILLAGLPKWALLDVGRSSVTVALARLAGAARRYDVVDREVPPEALGQTVEAAIGALRPPDARAVPDDRLIDTAAAVGEAFSSDDLLGMTDWDLLPVLSGFVDARLHSPGPTLAAYRRYLPEGPVVAAGVVTSSEWTAVAQRLFAPMESVVPLLRDFSIEPH